MDSSEEAKRAAQEEFAHAEAAAALIRQRLGAHAAGTLPQIAVVLGSGLGALATALTDAKVIPFAEIPHFPRSTALGHAGQLIIGKLDDIPVAVMQGRVHQYEGYSARQTAFPMRVLGQLGVRVAVLTNAAGGINPTYRPGSLVLIADHINLQGANPLTGCNDERFGVRFPDMSEAYSGRLRALAHAAASEMQLELPEGVYAALAGPSFETPAEIRFLERIGADLVGMSTVPEVIVARHMGIAVLALSCVTNLAAGLSSRKLTHEEVLEVGRQSQDRLTMLLRHTLPLLATELQS